MRRNILCLSFAASLAFEAVAQTTTISVGVDDEDDYLSSVTTSATSSVNPRMCGYIDGDPELPVTCSSSCAILSLSGRDSIYLGCCDDDQCYIPTTCIESGTPSGSATLACTEESRSRCGTLTWPDLSGKRYGCGTTQLTLTVATEATGVTLSSIETTSDIVYVTKTAAPNPDDDGGPGMGWEHDMSSKQRVGAGVGSGVIGGLLLIFFGIFGCWRGPARREPQPRTQRQDADQSDVHPPGEKAAMKRRVTDRVTMEETQPSASWTPSPIDIQSPQPIRPQPPFYPTSDMPGSSMGYRNPQYQ